MDSASSGFYVRYSAWSNLPNLLQEVPPWSTLVNRMKGQRNRQHRIPWSMSYVSFYFL
jgi:hypothetical protein